MVRLLPVYRYIPILERETQNWRRGEEQQLSHWHRTTTTDSELTQGTRDMHEERLAIEDINYATPWG